MSKEQFEYTAIPGINNIPPVERTLNMEVLAHEAIRALVSGLDNTDIFWAGLSERMPTLVKLENYKNAVTNSAQVERSDSICNIILSAHRCSQPEKSKRCLVFLHNNPQGNQSQYYDHRHHETDTIGIADMTNDEEEDNIDIQGSDYTGLV